jgi:hypothetical protein
MDSAPIENPVNGGVFSYTHLVGVRASAGVGSRAVAEALLEQETMTGPSEDADVFAAATRHISAADLATALEGNASSQGAFAPVSQTLAYGRALLAAGAAGSAGAALDAAFDITLSEDLAGSMNLLRIGFLDPELSGSGVADLHVRIEFDGALVLDDTFASDEALLSFFDDHVIDVGGLMGGDPFDEREDSQLLRLLFEGTGGAEAGSFAFDVVVGVANVPEPRLSLLVCGLLTALVARRRASRSPPPVG